MLVVVSSGYHYLGTASSYCWSAEAASKMRQVVTPSKQKPLYPEKISYHAQMFTLAGEQPGWKCREGLPGIFRRMQIQIADVEGSQALGACKGFMTRVYTGVSSAGAFEFRVPQKNADVRYKLFGPSLAKVTHGPHQLVGTEPAVCFHCGPLKSCIRVRGSGMILEYGGSVS